MIRNEKEYNEKMDLLSVLMEKDPSPSSPEGKKLAAIADEISAYEHGISTLGVVDPVEAILFRMEQGGFQQKDLVPFLGSHSRVSEILSGKRKLSKQMITNLHRGLGIPLESLHGIATVPETGKDEYVPWRVFSAKDRACDFPIKMFSSKPVIRRKIHAVPECLAA